MPAAFVGASRALLDPVEPLEQPRHLVGGDAVAGIPHRQLGGVPGLPQRDGDLALEGELEGVGEQVEDDLLPHLAVHDRPARPVAGSRRLSRSPARSQAERKMLARSAVKRGQVGRLVDGLDPARLDAGEVEQRVDQLAEPQAVAVDDLQPLSAAGGSSRLALASMSSTGPSMSVSGVRNSWLTLEKKAVLARSSSASASARLRSSS